MLRRGYHRSKTSRTHHTDIASTSLAAGQTTSWIQDCQLGIPSADKQSTWLSGRRYSSRLRKFCSLHQVLFGEKVLCHSCSQSFWWQMFCCSWTTYLEQLTCQSARQGSQLHRIQKTTENIHVSDELRRIVTFLNIAPYTYSYLLNYLRLLLGLVPVPALVHMPRTCYKFTCGCRRRVIRWKRKLWRRFAGCCCCCWSSSC